MNIRPKKSLGQNFLVNPGILDKIVSTALITKDDTIIEVGPGTGNLTKKLADKAGRIIAIEKDERLIKPLKEAMKNYPNVEIIKGDVLRLENLNLEPNGYKIVANIPYYITSNFLRVILEKWPQPKLIVLTIQKEVAKRIMTKPPHTNLLALSVQLYAQPEIVGYISKNSFRPVPKVDSAIIKLTPRELPLSLEPQKLLELIKAGFSEKRKKLSSNLSGKFKLSKEKITQNLEQAGINPNARAENLSLEQWITFKNYLGT